MTDDAYEDVGIGQRRKPGTEQRIGQKARPPSPLPGTWTDYESPHEAETEAPNEGKHPTYRDPAFDRDSGGPVTKIMKPDGLGIGRAKPGIEQRVTPLERTPSAMPGEGRTAPSQVAMHTFGEVAPMPTTTPRAEPDEVDDQPDANSEPKRGSRIEERPEDLRGKPTQARRPTTGTHPGEEERTP